jgi:hypothetical protein
MYFADELFLPRTKKVTIRAIHRIRCAMFMREILDLRLIFDLRRRLGRRLRRR